MPVQAIGYAIIGQFWIVPETVKTTRLKEILDQARMRLSSRLEADVLVAHAIGQDRAYLYAHDNDHLDDGALDAVAAIIKKRQLGHPVAYLLGSKEFYGRSFKVDPNVLIPRPETELLIDHIQSLPLPAQTKAVDVGTGSGCIGLTLAAENPQWLVCVTDLSEDAVRVCQTNRDTLGLMNVVIYKGSLLQPLTGQTFDLIVANLPYISSEDPHLSQGDLRYEPTMALIAENQGLSLIHQLIKTAPRYLNSVGHLVLEHGHDQQEALVDTLVEVGFEEITRLTDLAGQPRALSATWRVSD